MCVNVTHTYKTHIQSAGRHILCCFLLHTCARAHTHTHTHTRMCVNFTSFMLMANTRTHRYVRGTHSSIRITFVTYTPTHTKTNIFVHCYFALTFPNLLCIIKKYLFGILIVVKFLLSALFIFCVEQHSEFCFQ